MVECKGKGGRGKAANAATVAKVRLLTAARYPEAENDADVLDTAHSSCYEPCHMLALHFMQLSEIDIHSRTFVERRGLKIVNFLTTGDHVLA